MAAPASAGGDGSLARARAAVRRRAWGDAFTAYAAADRVESLAADDLRDWSTAAYLVGRVDVAVDALTGAFWVLRDSGDVGGAVRTTFWLFYIHSTRGEPAQAGGWLERGMRLTGQADDPAAGSYLLCVEAFRLAAGERRFADALAAADRAVALGHDVGDEDVVALSLNTAGRSLIELGRPAEGFARLDEAMTAVVSGAVSPIVSGTVYCSMIDVCEQIADLRRAHEWTGALERWCARQSDLVTFTGQCLTHRAAVLRRTGRLSDAAREAALACERFAGGADEPATGIALYEVAEVHRVRGELAQAEDAYRRAADWGREPQPGLALTRLAQGRADDAAASLRRLLAERSDATDRIGLLPAQVEVMLTIGDLEAASAAADELGRHAATFGSDALTARAEHARGAVLLAAGDPAAGAPLRGARQRWEALGAHYEAARSQALLGQVCRRAGDHDSAAVHLDAARRAFRRFGAAADLAALPTDGAARPFDLTPREREVLRLVARGLTNRAIAERLHVAVRTVDRHVTSILRKLDVPTRTAATAVAYNHDLL